MTNPLSPPLAPSDAAKDAAARRAAAMVEDGMRLGLGTGSTAAFLLRALGERVRGEGLRVGGVPTSERTAALARAEGIAVLELDATPLDLAIDGADEVDGALSLIKGGGGALLREKIVAAASRRMVVIADASKRVGRLGAFPLPVEVVRFGWPATQAAIARALAGQDVDGRAAALRRTEGAPFVTDEGHHVIDLQLGRIGDAPALSAALLAVPGVVETGLFLGLCRTLVVGHPDGRAEVVGEGAA